VDALRGFAIVAMVAANMAAHSLREPHPLAFRLYGSLAAPTFIFLSGMLVGQSREPGRAGLLRALKRTLVLWGWAVVLDVGVWQVEPFDTFDVLYVIGLALPAAWLCGALPAAGHAMIAALVLLLTPWLQQRFGYRLSLSGEQEVVLDAAQRLLVDGWFPIFPWLGVALGGALVGRLRKAASPLVTPRALLVQGAQLCLLGIASWALAPHGFPTRAGYSELFYPPSFAVATFSLGLVLALLGAVPRVRLALPLGWLEVLGRASLPLYVVHCAVIGFVTKRWFPDRALPTFALLYLGHLALLGALARAWAELKRAGFLAQRRTAR
jgi:uncharacterized membrane protein